MNVYISPSWYDVNAPSGGYSFKDSTNGLIGITVVPGDIPIKDAFITGNPLVGAVYITNAQASNMQRLSFLSAHELLGHMYKFLKNDPFLHNNPNLNDWIATIESEANKNWRLIKKGKKAKSYVLHL